MIGSAVYSTRFTYRVLVEFRKDATANPYLKYIKQLIGVLLDETT